MRYVGNGGFDLDSNLSLIGSNFLDNPLANKQSPPSSVGSGTNA